MCYLRTLTDQKGSKENIELLAMLFGFHDCEMCRTATLSNFKAFPHLRCTFLEKFSSPEASGSFIWMGATGPGDYSITISDASGAITLRMGNCPSPQPFFCAAIIHQSLYIKSLCITKYDSAFPGSPCRHKRAPSPP